MGGKGRKRREKNYRAAHGGHTRLPPPPDPSQVDALPSKLRKIMSFAPRDGSAKDAQEKRKRDGDDHKKDSVKNVVNEEARRDDSDNEIARSNNANEKRNKKRKRKQVTDLRFGIAEELGSVSKRKERKKKYFEEKKKKKKKAETKDVLNFPGHESIKFGEVVEAPPKLAVIPKAFKSAQNASQERLRLKAIEDYRNRKGWSSRPGLHLPRPVTTSP
ncbi:hypothetical protein HS088_TW17G00507 [Tripterygium wilfordii]|uniref:Coiled-coil domain-containing protein n=1 Tax=Tripterygium wilfordii TaxID=458696 RepID=A0A7J7CFS1_TRIWF|nr:uncharacterized protein LOC119982882 [Tripterygium wilfordii]KAF5732973.1 hypothetical protein HS088_TW17G00507 [Tripterygium wilfordii]